MNAARLYIGCTRARHAALGIDAVVNARGGHPELNATTDDAVALERDGRAIRDRLERRVRWYGPHSKFFRRHRARVAHLIAGREDD